MLLEHEGDYGLGMDVKGTVCMLLEHEGDCGLGMDANGTVCMLLEHEGDFGLGMDAKETVCSWSTKEIMVWAWMQRKPYALGPRRRLWFGHGCKGNRMLLEHEGPGSFLSVC